jgi:outer membrane receptor protein involved in Fe transport
MQKVATAAEESGENRQEEQEEPAAGDDKKQELTVTGTRIRGLVGQQSIQPVLTITKEDIERYGVSSLAEVLRYIPQVSSAEQGQVFQNPLVTGQPSLPTSITSNRVTATLRGAPLDGTLLLVNGRRVPKNGQSIALSGTSLGFFGQEAYDLSGIPLAAVERIDVLLDGASAIYGADAVGGVINVILKRDYRGTEMRLNYDNPFDTDASVKTVGVTHGFASEKFSVLLGASWEETNALMWPDRNFLLSFDRRHLGGSDGRFASNFDGPGAILSNPAFPVTPLPGLTTDRLAIPAGSAGAGLTVADYVNAGPLPGPFDHGAYLLAATPYERLGVTGNMEYEFTPALKFFAEARWGESRTASTGAPLFAFNLVLPAGAPGNPFGTAIRFNKRFFDLPPPARTAATENQGVTAGLRGDIFRGWRYEAAVHDVRGLSRASLRNVAINQALLTAAMAGPNPPVLLYDSTTGVSPNPPGTIEMLTTVSNTTERTGTRTFDVQLDGPAFALPAGEVGVSFGGEYREEQLGFPVAATGLNRRSGRYTSGFFAEARVPLISRKQGWPLVHNLEASLAVRRDDYSDFGGATSPRYGLLYQPVEWLKLRGSYGEGYKVPTLGQLHLPPIAATATVFWVDAARGGEVQFNFLPTVIQGNPALQPERSENVTAGIVLNVPFVEGLSLSFDHYDSKYLGRVGLLELTDLIVLSPEKVTRGPNLPGDQPGWPGRVTSFLNIPDNVGETQIAGYDVSLDYYRPTASWGTWTMKATLSQIRLNEVRASPDLPPQPSSLPSNLPAQINGSIFWEHGAFRTGTLCTYREETFAELAPDGTVFGPFIPSAIRWDWQGSYDFSRSNWAALNGSRWGRLLDNTRINLTVFNVLDKDPPLFELNTFPDTTVIDARLRRYAISVIKNF